MIYAFTSKKNGCGRTLVAMLSTIVTSDKISGSTILVDLGYGNDIYSLLKVNKPYASLDNLITEIGLDSDYINFDDNVVESNGFFFLPGTSVTQTRYLERRYIEIKALLDLICTRFNSVILDIDYALYEDLVGLGLEITPIHVIDQNILNVEKYQHDIQKQIFNGYYVLNNYDSSIFPQYSFFEKNFKQGSVIVVDKDLDFQSILNRRKLTLSAVSKSKCYKGISMLSAIIAKDTSVLTSKYVSKGKSRKGLFGFFKRGKGKGGKK